MIKTYDMKPAIKRKLDLSKQETIDLAQRDLRCPSCHFLVSKVYGDASGHIEFKCPKCKDIYVINFNYFRSRTRRFLVTLIKVIG